DLFAIPGVVAFADVEPRLLAAPIVVAHDLEAARLGGGQAAIGYVIARRPVGGVALVENLKGLGIGAARHEPEDFCGRLALAIDPRGVAEPTIAQLAETFRIDTGDGPAVAVDERRAVDHHAVTVVDVADGGETALADIDG